MNNVQLIGRLVRNPERKSPESPATFTVACDGMKKDDTDFIRCKAFGKTGDNLMKYWYKGKPIAVTGRIKTGSYEGRDWKTVYTTDVICDRVEFVPRDSTIEAQPTREEQEAHAVRKVAEAARQESFDDFAAIDEEVPF